MKNRLAKICMIAQFLCIHNMWSSDNLTDHLLFNEDQGKAVAIYVTGIDFLKLQLNKLDQFHVSLLNEQNYCNRLSRCWKQCSDDYRLTVKDFACNMIHCVLYKGADPNIASDISKIRILHLMSALTSPQSLRDIERLVVDHNANPFLKDAYGNDAFTYAKQSELRDKDLYQKIVTVLHKYKAK